jgi:hypothetical protein
MLQSLKFRLNLNISTYLSHAYSEASKLSTLSRRRRLILRSLQLQLEDANSTWLSCHLLQKLHPTELMVTASRSAKHKHISGAHCSTRWEQKQRGNH